MLAGNLEAEFLRRQKSGYIIPQAVNTQSSAPEDGRDCRPKLVERRNSASRLPAEKKVGALYHKL